MATITGCGFLPIKMPRCITLMKAVEARLLVLGEKYQGVLGCDFYSDKLHARAKQSASWATF
ncbi:MAG TPA: hypothetical protein DCY61_00135 [Dehalococcoidia bacterium]|nr:hypothetical protein [Dehalococcoidia bacterium]